MGSYCEDYQGWTVEKFKKVDVAYLRELKRALRDKEAATGHPSAPVIPMPVNSLELEDPLECEENHLLVATFDPDSYAYRLQQEIKRQPRQQISQIVDTAECKSSQQDNSLITFREDPRSMQEQQVSPEQGLRENIIATERSFVKQRDKYGRLSATPYPDNMRDRPPHTLPEITTARD